jgi:hypothetical protein
VNDLSAARAREPDLPVVLSTIQITAALVLSGERHEGAEHVRHVDWQAYRGERSNGRPKRRANSYRLGPVR